MHCQFKGQNINEIPKRLGVLESQNNGHHDLVWGVDEVLTWKDGEYTW